MSFNDLIEIKKSRVKPKQGDIFVVQPVINVFYYGKVIKTELESTNSFIKGMSLIYIYNKRSEEIVIPQSLHSIELLIPPIVVNNQPWIKGYFKMICNEPISKEEMNIDFGFWSIPKNQFLSLDGVVLDKEPKYWSYYGLGSYGVVGKEIQKAISKL